MKNKFLGFTLLVLFAIVVYIIYYFAARIIDRESTEFDKINTTEQLEVYTKIIEKGLSLDNSESYRATSKNKKFVFSFDMNGIYIKNDTNWRCKDFGWETTSLEKISLSHEGDLIAYFQTNDYWKWDEHGEKYLFHEEVEPIYIFRNNQLDSATLRSDIRLILDNAGYLLILKYENGVYDKRTNALWLSNLNNCQDIYTTLTKRKLKIKNAREQRILKEKVNAENINNRINNVATEGNSKNIDGVYTFTDNSAKLIITINGNTWIGKTIMVTGVGSDYDGQNAQFERGLVQENELYDESGNMKIGYIEGTALITSIGGQEVILKK